MPRKKKYTKKEFSDAVERYFASITRIVTVTEKVASDEKDEYGHVMYVDVPITNTLGEEVREMQYILPPTVGGLCAALGISRETWNRYGESKTFGDTVSRARGRMRAWNERELLTRSGRDVKGIIFNLQNNYGYCEKQSVTVTGSVEEYLKTREKSGEGEQTF